MNRNENRPAAKAIATAKHGGARHFQYFTHHHTDLAAKGAYYSATSQLGCSCDASTKTKLRLKQFLLWSRVQPPTLHLKVLSVRQVELEFQRSMAEGKKERICILYTLSQREFLPWEISPRKASCNRVALPNPN